MRDSVVYALILDGSSPFANSARRYACVRKSLRNGNYDHRGILEQAQTLIIAAKEVGHNLKVEPDILESSIRASAFFLPQKYRKGSKVEAIARNKAQEQPSEFPEKIYGVSIFLEGHLQCQLHLPRADLRHAGDCSEIAVADIKSIVAVRSG